MKNTRYWKKITEGGGFWSKCKDQENTKADDGRQLYRYTKPNPGERWQYESRTFGGAIESFFIRESQYGAELCIGIASEDRVNVLQIPLWAKEGKLDQDFKGFAKKVPNLDIQASIDFSTWTNLKGKYEWKDREGNTHSRIPTHIIVYQDNGALRNSVKSAFDYVDGSYVGVPKAESAQLGGKTVYDYTEQNNFFIDLVRGFADKHDEMLKGRRESRASTPAEIETKTEPALSIEDDSDLPF
jgi:hypothetical protein